MYVDLTQEQEGIRNTVRKAAREKIAPLVKEIDIQGKFSWEVCNLLFDLGLLSMTIPEKYGGLNTDHVTICIVIEELSRVDPLAGNLVYGTLASLEPLLHHGTEEQKDKYLTKIVNERKLIGICVTEASAGSDIKAIETKAVKKGNEYVLNGAKIFVSYGGVSEFFNIFAVSGISGNSKIISNFLVERNFPGFNSSKEGDKLGLRGQNTTDLFLDDVHVPIDNLIGREGEGPKIALEAIDIARLGLGAQCVGLGEEALEYSLNYAKERIQFGKPIAEFQAIQMMLADMAINVEAARALTYKAAVFRDKKDDRAPCYLAMVKVFCSDMALKVAIDAVQILGGHGCFKDHPVEKMMRDAKMCQIIDGTNQINRLIVVRNILRKGKIPI